MRHGFKLDATKVAETVLYSFTGGTDGACPANKGLIYQGGALFGLTRSGAPDCGIGLGTVFKLNPLTGIETVLYSFAGGTDGIDPYALIYEGSALYGTTMAGGGNGCLNNLGCGTVFKLDIATGTETVLHRFTGGADAAYPSSLIYRDGVLYGTSFNGGSPKCNCGTIFTVNPTTGAEAVVYYSEDNRKGKAYVGMINHGALYGVTAGGGTATFGSLFVFNPTSNRETLLYSFSGGSAGSYPEAGLLFKNGAFYGTTSLAGNIYGCHVYVGCGTIFKFTP
jgi:uncharacterized repeat protein (TIGR03803 family)